MSRPGGNPKPKTGPHNSRNGPISQGVVFFSAFGVTQTNRDELDWTSDDALVEQIDLALIHSDLISLLLDSQIADSLV
jgi:hypothetical protein